MVKLKNKIRVIDSLPPEKKNKFSILKLLGILIFLVCIFLSGLFAYKSITPYLNAIDIKYIVGKKVYLSECNTKDYVIIGKDKSYSMTITDEKCNIKNLDGDIVIKDNKVFFDKYLVGMIDNNYNIIINGNLFVTETKNETETQNN